MTIIYKKPETKQDLADYYFLRWEMLRQPLNLPFGSEQDDLEKIADHIAAYENNIIVGVGRIHAEAEYSSRIRYMAVHKKFQNRGIGSALLKKLEKIAINNKRTTCWLYARENAINFYLKNNYVVSGTADSDLSIKHVKMEKKLL